jgi:thiamine-phosphate pyrophosphorylase
VASVEKKREQLRELMPLCQRYGCTLVVNDDWRLALELRIDAVHIGGDDGDVKAVRAAVGPEVILGVSCYADLGGAERLAPLADYLAFGSVFPSRTKPHAVSAALGIISHGKMLDRPVVAIGGVDASNASVLIEAGADAVAVITGVFGREPASEATRQLVDVVRQSSRGAPGNRPRQPD